MNILLNAIPLTGLMTGIPRYVRNLYRHLEQADGIHVYYFDGKRIYGEMPDQANPLKWIQATDAIWKLPDVAVVALRAIHWILYEANLRRTLKRGDYHLYHETAFTPASINMYVPQIFTLHDLSLIHYREMHPRERVWFSDLFFRRRIHQADHIITPSRFIRQEAASTLDIPPENISAIPEAPDLFFYPRPQLVVDAVLSRLRLPRKYFLYVGTLEPRKNIDILIRALAATTSKLPLVLVGWKGWGEKNWKKQIEKSGMEQRIILTSYLDDDSLAAVYSGALALVYPSLYEGFGLPILEGMASGTPVICSNSASLPEVAGSAAIYFDPQDHETLATLMDKVADGSAYRQLLIEQGIAQARKFSWHITAQKTLEVFKKIVGEECN